VPTVAKVIVVATLGGLVAFAVWASSFLARRARGQMYDDDEDYEDDPELPRLGLVPGPPGSGDTLHWY